MLMVRRNNYSNWLDNFFDDSLSDTELMPQRNTTAPALNVKETAEDYIMEMAVPGLEKEWVRINVTNEGLLHVAIENKMEHKEENRTATGLATYTTCAASLPMATTSRVTLCRMM